MNDFNAAVDSYEKALQIDPHRAKEIDIRLAETYTKMGDPEKAKDYYQKSGIRP